MNKQFRVRKCECCGSCIKYTDDFSRALQAITNYTEADPTVVTSVAHGLTTGDQITVSGSYGGAIDGTHTVTVLDADTFTLPIEVLPGLGGTGSFYPQYRTNLDEGSHDWTEVSGDWKIKNNTSLAISTAGNARNEFTFPGASKLRGARVTVTPAAAGDIVRLYIDDGAQYLEVKFHSTTGYTKLVGTNTKQVDGNTLPFGPGFPVGLRLCMTQYCGDLVLSQGSMFSGISRLASYPGATTRCGVTVQNAAGGEIQFDNFEIEENNGQSACTCGVAADCGGGVMQGWHDLPSTLTVNWEYLYVTFPSIANWKSGTTVVSRVGTSCVWSYNSGGLQVSVSVTGASYAMSVNVSATGDGSNPSYPIGDGIFNAAVYMASASGCGFFTAEDLNLSGSDFTPTNPTNVGHEPTISA